MSGSDLNGGRLPQKYAGGLWGWMEQYERSLHEMAEAQGSPEAALPTVFDGGVREFDLRANIRKEWSW